MNTYKINSHCSYCGEIFPQGPPSEEFSKWPKTCERCHKTTWLNPLPVVVVIVPILNDDESEADQILLVRRAVKSDEGNGKLAFPGGFLVVGETWQEGAARELFEETGIKSDPSKIFGWEPMTASNGNLLIFCQTSSMSKKDIHFIKNNEVSELVIVNDAIELAFPTHTEMLKRYFDYKAS